MSTFNEATMRTRILALGLVTMATGAACTELRVPNKAPVAVITLTNPKNAMGMNYATRTPMGFPNAVAQLPIFTGDPVDITLSAQGSSDADGTIKEYRWLRTDTPRPVRFPGTAP